MVMAEAELYRGCFRIISSFEAEYPNSPDILKTYAGLLIATARDTGNMIYALSAKYRIRQLSLIFNQPNMTEACEMADEFTEEVLRGKPTVASSAAALIEALV